MCSSFLVYISRTELLNFELLYFALKISYYILHLETVKFGMKELLHFVLKVVTFWVNVTFCNRSCYTSINVTITF